MTFKKCVLLMAILTIGIVGGYSVISEIQSNENLLSFMARSRYLMRNDPSRSYECFNYYIPLIEQIGKNYEANYKACEDAFQQGLTQAEANTLDKRNDLATRANNSCSLFSKCSPLASAENAFECYVDSGSKNTKIMYDINSKASEYLSDLQEEFHLIINRQYKCTNETKRTYENESGKAYSDFNNCIVGISEVPTKAPEETETTKKPEIPENSGKPTEAPAEIESTSPENAPSTESSNGLKVPPEIKLPEEDLS